LIKIIFPRYENVKKNIHKMKILRIYFSLLFHICCCSVAGGWSAAGVILMAAGKFLFFFLCFFVDYA